MTDPWWYVPREARVRYDLEYGSIANALRTTARRMPDAEALVAEDGRRSFGELDADMHAAVRSVLALGVRPGERVAVWGPNSGRWLVAALGILGAGAVLVPLNTRFKGEEAAYVLRKSGARALFATTDFLGIDHVEMLRQAGVEMTTVVLSGPSTAPCISISSSANVHRPSSATNASASG